MEAHSRAAATAARSDASAPPRTEAGKDEPRLHRVQCLGANGLHRIAYWEWGDAANPRVVVCAHGLTRQGRDFDTLARDLRSDFRVVCPDVVGRGRSDWLPTAAGYAVPNYVADMVTLIARLGVEQVDWVGTSMGGLIGMGLASLPRSPLRRLVLNDVGPKVEYAAIRRIAGYVGQPLRWATVDEAADALWSVSRDFGPHTRDEWLALTRPQLVPDTDPGDAAAGTAASAAAGTAAGTGAGAASGVAGWKPHYDPAIAGPVRAITPELAAAADAMLWAAYERIGCPTLVLRGAESDLLSHTTLQQMAERGPRATTQEFAGVGHAPTLVAADQRAVVRRFLSGP